MRRWLLVGLSFGGSAFLLWLVLRGVPLAEVIDGIRQADPFWLLVNAAFVVGTLWTRGVRWAGLLDNRVPLRDAFFVMSISMMLNQLPLRAGEVARSAITLRYDVPFFTSLTSILIERILDLLAVVIVIGLALPFAPGATLEAGQAAFGLGGLAMVSFIGLLFFARWPNVPRRILDRLTRLVPLLGRLPLRRFLDHILDGLQPLMNLRRLAHVLTWTVIAWAVSMGALYALTRALDIPADKQWVTTLLGVSFTAIGLALPLSVASLGPFQAALAFVGTLMLLDPVQAVTLGFLFNGMAVLGYVLWGTLGLFTLGLSLGRVFQQPQAQEAA
jgi:uncharacterized membrane protein YbhN (UPF0104 family)